MQSPPPLSPVCSPGAEAFTVSFTVEGEDFALLFCPEYFVSFGQIRHVQSGDSPISATHISGTVVYGGNFVLNS